MSSDEDEFNDGGTSSTILRAMKKRKTQRACDVCRRKKIRCDGVPTPGNRCSNCISFSVDCTYFEAAKKRGPLRAYVERLENRVNNIDKLLRQLCADEMHYKELTSSLDGKWTIELPPVDPSTLFCDPAIKDLPNTVNLESVTSVIRGSIEGGVDTTKLSADGDDPTLTLTDTLKRLSIVEHNRFLGKSSQASLIQVAIEMKNEYAGKEGEVRKPMMTNRRQEFTGINWWERESNEAVPMQYTFPDLDLALHCIDLYFKYSNLYLPLLHRPTFDTYVKEGLHLTDGGFAPVFLLVCAVGARYSDNPLVRLDGVDSHYSAGWKWFEQVQITKRSLLSPATLFDVQLYCLCILYLQGSSTAKSCWTLAGIGIRLAQDVGAHRRKEHNHKLTPNDELLKRAFWVLVCMDRMISSSLGRPCAVQDEHLDLDLPVDCDDEYWDNPDPEKCFKQPPNKPSLITFFILYLKLHQILAFSQQTIYSVDKSKILLGFVGQEWEKYIVAELDSALNKWVDSLPDHCASLRWDPNREDDNFFNQSVSLYAAYYNVQISIHRTFIPSPTKPSPLPFPSLAICTNAARLCSHVIYIQRKRNNNPPPLIQTPVFTAGIVLLLSILGSKRLRLSMDPDKVAAVQTCMTVLRSLGARWHCSGLLCNTLYEFAAMVELPLPQLSPPLGTKGAHESDSLLSSSATEPPFYPISQNEIPRTTAGSRRDLPFADPAPLPPSARIPHPAIPHIHQGPSRRQSDRQGLESQQPTFSISSSIDAELPVYLRPAYSNEFGRVPLNEQVTFSAQAQISQPQTQSPQLHSQINYWHPERSEPKSHPVPGGANSYWFPHTPLPAPQQQQHPHSHPAPRSIPGSGIFPISEMSSSQDAYGMHMFDTPDAFTQQQNAGYGLRAMDSSGAGRGSNLPSNSSMSRENIYGISASGRSGGNFYHQHQHQHQGVPQQQEQQAFAYPFTVGNDEVPISSNNQTFEWNERAGYLAMQGNTPYYPPV